MSTIDHFTSTCFEHPKIEQNARVTGEITLETKEEKNQKKKKKKEDNYNATTNRNCNNKNRNNNNKTNVYILDDSKVKKLNGYLLTRKINRKHLVEMPSFFRGENQFYGGPC